MAWRTGKGVLCGIRKAATWGTAIDVDAAGGIGLIVDSFSYSDNIADLRDLGYNASALERETTLTGRHACAFQFTIKQKYQGLELPYALFFGTAGVPSGVGPYVHTFPVKHEMNGIFFTMAYYDDGTTHEWDSCKFVTLSEAHSPGNVSTTTFGAIARKRSEDSVINPNITSIAEPAAIDFVQWLNSTKDHKIAAKAGTLANIELNSVTINLARQYTIEGAYVDEFIREPAVGAFTGNVAIVRPHEDMTYINPGAIHKLYFLYTKTAALKSATGFPSMKVLPTAGPVPTDKGGYMQTANFSVHQLPTSAPSGFTLLTPLKSFTNSLATDPLA